MSEWQTIETAPKDGTKFLGAWKTFFLKEWIIQTMKFKDGSFVILWDHDDDIEPTHWMPLPQPPKDAA